MILFLDYDGVLHDSEVYMVRGQIELRSKDPHARLFQHAEALADILDMFPWVSIVLSTSWVPRLSFDEAKAYLPEELQARVVGATFHSKAVPTRQTWYLLSRFYQIDTYVSRHGVTNWLALDDDANGWPDSHRQHLVHCANPEKGLGSKRVQNELIRKLKENFNAK